MPLATNPRDFRFAPLVRERLTYIVNRDNPDDRGLAEWYCDQRGIPRQNIVELSLGTNAQSWSPPGGNAAIQSEFVTPLLAHEARYNPQPSGRLLGAGVPSTVRVLGKYSGGTYTPDSAGFPPLATLASGAGSYADQLGTHTLIARDGTSGRWSWARSAFLPAITDLWPFALPEVQGVGTAATMTQASYLDALASSFVVQLPTTLATQYTAGPLAKLIPVGQVGWAAYQVQPIVEDRDRTAAKINAALSARFGINAEPAPALVMIRNVTTSPPDMVIWAALARRMREWGYSVEYFYRQTPAADAEALAPIAGAAFTAADFEGGAVVRRPFYLLVGAGTNSDLYNAPYTTALAPAKGAGVGPVGPSLGYRWAWQALEDGAAWGIADQTHKTQGQHYLSWAQAWCLLTGMTVMEAVFYTARDAATLAVGDPLVTPYRFARAAPVASLVPRRRLVID